jgi:hypothetical protein
MSDQSKRNGSCEPCDLRPFERNRYFDGKLLVTRDFEAEQAYLRGKDRLHNSLLHGTGTVCGLKLEEHDRPECRHQYVVLNPGLALDCCGNEIVVHEKKVIDLRADIEAALRAKGRFPESGQPEQTSVYVRLAYRECDTEKVPALLDDCGCNETNTEYNRTRETYRLFVDLDAPEDEAKDRLDARLKWKHTLNVDRPSATIVDRELERLYLAEWDGSSGQLRMYNTVNHEQLVRVPIGEREPTAMTRSNLGDLIYIAEVATEEADPRIVVFDQRLLETEPETAQRDALFVPGGADVRRLDVSVRDDSLFALTADGRILRWSSDAVRGWLRGGAEPEPVVQNLTDATGGGAVAPADMSQASDGRWMVVADGESARLIVLNLAQFDPSAPVSNRMKSFALANSDVPQAVEISFDGKFLYVLCVNLSEFPQNLYRIRLGDALDTFIPEFSDEHRENFSILPLADEPRGGALPRAVPVDMSVSPRDNWVYLLRRLRSEGEFLDRGEVMIISVDELNRPGEIDRDSAEKIIRRGANTAGDARFHTLAFLGQKLYVAGETPTGEGRINVLDVDEAACDTFIRRTIEGCPSCKSASEGVIIASIQNYQWNGRMVNVPSGDEEAGGPNIIDNFTHREMVPSTSALRQVIECMLEKGISEGIPGPRGPVGPRGSGITEAAASSLAPGQPPTATLEIIPGDIEGDQRLVLGIPRGEPGAPGQNGAPGPRGPGITQVSVTTLAPGANATASLEPIVGDPQGDQRLRLGIPRGERGESAPRQEFNRVINASWHHDEIFSPDEFVEWLRGTGLLIAFESPVRTDTLHDRSAFVLVRRREQTFFGELGCDCVLPAEVEPARLRDVAERDVHWLVGNAETHDIFRLLTEIDPVPDAFASAVRLVLPEQFLDEGLLREAGIFQLTVVLRGDWILDERDQALDGNHIWPGVPDRPSGNGTQGNDWLSIIHIRQDR